MSIWLCELCANLQCPCVSPVLSQIWSLFPKGLGFWTSLSICPSVQHGPAGGCIVIRIVF
uniref:Uncharacterized protein n=1 Tax=Rhizophora mucronata TaxID=61149 RepID=A0A2P2KBZ7_RHIMU